MRPFWRHVWGWLLVAGVACGAPPVEIALPNDPVAQSRIVALESGRIELVALEGDRGVDALPFDERFEPGRTAYVTVISYDKPLAELGLVPGVIERPVATPEILRFREIRQLAITDGKAGAFTVVSVLRDTVLARLVVPCSGRIHDVDGELTCQPNECTGPDCARRFCFEPPELLAGLPPGGIDRDPTIAVEDGQPVLYFVSDRFEAAPQRFGHVRVELGADGRARAGTLAQVVTSSLAGEGEVGYPALSTAGREVFFASARPDGADDDQEIYSASRGEVGEPWSRGILTIGALEPGDAVTSPLLLPDRRTLLAYSPIQRGWISRGVIVFLRETTAAGDRSFELIGPGYADPGFDVRSQAASCDGWHVLYVRERGGLNEALAARISSLVPFRTQRAERLESLELGGRVRRVSESPDCKSVYLSDEQSIYVARACE